LTALCRDAVGGDADKTELIELMFQKDVLDVWGKSGNEDCALWNKLWQEAIFEFPKVFEKIVSAADFSKPMPDHRTYIPALLLMVLSPEYRTATKEAVAVFSGQAARCSWLAPVLVDDSFAALLAALSFRDEAVSLGDREIDSANTLEKTLAEMERDHADLLTPGSAFRRGIEEMRTSIAGNRAFKALTDDLPDLRKRLFEASRALTVTASFKTIRRRMWPEILADGLLVACLLVAVRMWMGSDIAGDAFGSIAARLSPFLDGASAVKKYLFAGLAGVSLAWVALRFTNRRLSRRLFGK
jgi:hypothetical protein